MVLFTMHHIVSDGWSMGVLIREVGSALPRHTARESPRRWRSWRSSMRISRSGRESGCRGGAGEGAGLLAGAVGREWKPWNCRPIIRGRRRGAIEEARQRFVVEREVSGEAESAESARRSDAVYDAAGGLRCVADAVQRAGRCGVGTDIANRNRAEIEGLIGFFVNQLVMRTDMSRESRVSES